MHGEAGERWEAATNHSEYNARAHTKLHTNNASTDTQKRTLACSRSSSVRSSSCTPLTCLQERQRVNECMHRPNRSTHSGTNGENRAMPAKACKQKRNSTTTHNQAGTRKGDKASKRARDGGSGPAQRHEHMTQGWKRPEQAHGPQNEHKHRRRTL